MHPEDIEESINEKTIALLYVKSHHSVQKGMVSIETMRDIAHAHGLPFMMDCAAEEDFRKYIALGADVVCYQAQRPLRPPPRDSSPVAVTSSRTEAVPRHRPRHEGGQGADRGLGRP